MPRGVRLTAEERNRRILEKEAKIAERRFNKTQGIKRVYKRKSPEELASIKAQKAERMFAFTQGTFTPKPYKPRPRLTEAQKAERLFAFTQRVPSQRAPRRRMTQAEKDARKAERMFAFTQGTSNQKPRLTPAERQARKAERMFAFTQGTYTPKPYKPRTPAQKEQAKLRKQGRALQALAETIPLPPDTQRRVRVIRGGGSVPRMPSIRSQLPDEAM